VRKKKKRNFFNIKVHGMHGYHRAVKGTWEGTAAGGSILIDGSHSPGGRTVTASRNSSTAASRWLRLRALYATSWNTSSDMSVAMARPTSWKFVSPPCKQHVVKATVSCSSYPVQLKKNHMEYVICESLELHKPHEF